MAQEYKVHLDYPFYGDFSLESLCEPVQIAPDANISSTFQGTNKDPYILSNDPSDTSADLKPSYWSAIDAYSSFTANTLRNSTGAYIIDTRDSSLVNIPRVCKCTDTSTVVLTNDKQGSYIEDESTKYFYYYYYGSVYANNTGTWACPESGNYRIAACSTSTYIFGTNNYCYVYLNGTQILSKQAGYNDDYTKWSAYVDRTLKKGDIITWTATVGSGGSSGDTGKICVFVNSVTFNTIGITSNGNWYERGSDNQWIKWSDYTIQDIFLSLPLDSSVFRSSDNIKYSNLTPIISTYLGSLPVGDYYISSGFSLRAAGQSSSKTYDLAYITKSGNSEGSIYGRSNGRVTTPAKFLDINTDTCYEINGSIRLLGIKFTDITNKEIYRSFRCFKTNSWNNAYSDPVHTGLYIDNKSNENYLTNFFLEPNGNGEILLCKKGCYPTPVEFCRVTSGTLLTIRTSYYANENSSHDGEFSLQIGNQRFFADSFRSGSIPEYIGFLICGAGGGSGGRATGSADKSGNFGTYPGGGGGGGGITTGVIWLPRNDGICGARNDYYYNLTIGSGGEGGTYSGSASTSGGNGGTGGNTILYETYWSHEDDDEVRSLLIRANGGKGGKGGTDAGNPDGGEGGTVYESASHEISPLEIESVPGSRGNNPTTGGSTGVSLSRKFSDSRPYSQGTPLVERPATGYSQNTYAGGGSSFGNGGTSSSAAGYGGGGCGIQGGNNSGGGGIAIFYY